MLLGRSI
jgi:hypothetical protein